jgi:hypothetical protein
LDTKRFLNLAPAPIRCSGSGLRLQNARLGLGAPRNQRPPAAATDQRARSRDAMEFFPDGGFVRLQCREYGTYLHADEDGVSLTLRPERASLNAAWRVHQIVRNNITYVLLYGAAYGRYLKSTKKRGPLGFRGQRVVQGFYDEPDDNAVVWVAARVEAGGNLIFLRQVSGNRVLRANGKHFQWMRTGVSVDSYFNRSTMMHWVVEVIPPLPAVPIFPPPPAVPARAPVR